MMKSEIGAGYRQLEVGETIATGDDVQISGQWDSTADAGRKIGEKDMVYRRRVAEYRLLQPGEVIVAGDEYRLKYKAEDRTWVRTSDAGRKLMVGEDLEYRRPHTPPAYRNFLSDCFLTGQEPWAGKIISTAERIETNPGPEPEYGWRLLRPGEVVVDGDRSVSYDGSWEKFASRGMVIKHGRVERRIEPGEGYRLLTVGERIVEGDDIYWGGKTEWSPTALIGAPVRDAVFRRKVCAAQVDPGEGYRLLAIGETIEQGDEAYDSDQWIPRKAFVGKSYGSEMLPTRRKLAVDPGAGYRLLAIGETIAAGDEFLSESYPLVWEPRTLTVGEKIANGYHPTRRRVVIDLGAGYRRLSAWEIIAEGDEFFNSDAGFWERFHYAIGSELADPITPARRRIEPLRSVTEKRYRLLSVGEIISPGDEMYHRSEWAPCLLLGVLTQYDLPVRREMELGYIGGPA